MDAALRAELERWMDRADTLLTTDPLPPIRVLVWGPGEAADDPDHEFAELRRKRLAVVDDLRAAGLVAATSEELARSSASVAPLNALERAHAQEADVILLFPGTQGTLGELAGLVTSRQIARRTAVLYDSRNFTGTYADRGPLASVRPLVVELPYDEDDVQSCQVKTIAVRFALDQAERLRGTTP